MSDEKRLAIEICDAYLKVYKDRKIWITRDFGKRSSFLAGSGEEKYARAVKFELFSDYSAFVESVAPLDEEEQHKSEELLKTIFKEVVERI